MTKVAQNAVSILALAVFVLSGCILIDQSGAVVYCDRVELDYSFTSSDFNTYELQIMRLSDGEPLSGTRPVTGDAPGSVSFTLDEKQPEGTELYLRIDSTHYTEYAVACSTEGTRVDSSQWFEPGDDRINRQAYAYASVYCDADNQRVGIYGIHSTGAGDPDRNDGMGFPAIFIPYAELPPTPTDSNVQIASYGNIGFYRLTSGEYQINAGPDAEGKSYVLVWDGCPQTYIKAYMLQNGVLTQTEVYPRAD